MKISIWQQFSSNHSASFTLVGLFKSYADAEAAAVKMRDLIARIALWHAENPELSRIICTLRRELPDLISAPEREAGIEYQIDWSQPFVCFHDYEITTYAQLLFLHNTRASLYGVYPLYEFIERMGGEAYVEGQLLPGDVSNKLKLMIRCDPPNPETAAIIAEELHGEVYQARTVRLNIELKNRHVDGLRPKELIAVLERLRAYGCTKVSLWFETQQFRLRILRLEEGS